jgi:hypothetical protein
MAATKKANLTFHESGLELHWMRQWGMLAILLKGGKDMGVDSDEASGKG